MMKLSDLNRALKLQEQLSALRDELRKSTQPISSRYVISASELGPSLIEIRVNTSLEDEVAAFNEVQEAIRKMLQGRIDRRERELAALGVDIDK